MGIMFEVYKHYITGVMYAHEGGLNTAITDQMYCHKGDIVCNALLHV